MPRTSAPIRIASQIKVLEPVRSAMNTSLAVMLKVENERRLRRFRA